MEPGDKLPILAPDSNGPQEVERAKLDASDAEHHSHAVMLTQDSEGRYRRQVSYANTIRSYPV